VSRRVVLIGVLAVALGGCAVPGWVPWLGKKKEEPRAPAVAAAPRAPEEPKTDRPVERGPAAEPRDESVTDRVIAVVNNDAITLGDLQQAIATYRLQGRQEGPPSDEFVRQFLTKMIDHRLQLQEAEREKIVVEEAEVDEELAERIKKMNLSGREELDRLLKQQGLTVEAVKKNIRDEFKVARVIGRKVRFRVSVTDAEIVKYVEANREKLETGLGYHARHILIPPEAGASDAAWEAARIKAELLRTQLLQGADFAELARQHSRDAGTAKDGGDLGTLKRGELAQDVESQILSLSPGEVSKPYRSTLGYHIFRLESKESLEGEGLTRAQAQIKEILFREKFEARLETWLKQVKQRAVVEIRL
jgi:peptidyl-prolyl cis-trans isomerase SurA